MNDVSIIHSLDMSAVAAKLIAKGMSEGLARKACEAGRKDLLLIAAHVGQAVVPTAIGDQAIHELLEMPEACRAIAEAVAGPGAQIVHIEGPGGDWQRSQQWREQLFGDASGSDDPAGCMLELKRSEPAGCMMELRQAEPAGCMMELKPVEAAGCMIELRSASTDRPCMRAH